MQFLQSSVTSSVLGPNIQSLHNVLCFYSKELLPLTGKEDMPAKRRQLLLFFISQHTVTLEQTEVTADSKCTYNGNHL